MANINDLFEDLGSQFRDINGVHPGLWPILPRLVAALLLFLGVCGLGWYFYWDDQTIAIDKGQQEEQKLKDIYKNKMIKSINLDELKRQHDLVQQYVKKMEGQLPSTADYGDLLAFINRAADGHGLMLELFKPGVVSVKDYYAELPVELQIIANYQDMGKFVSEIAKMPRIVTLNNLTLTVSKDAKKPGISLVGVAKTYRYLDQEEIALQAAEKKKNKDGKK